MVTLCSGVRRPGGRTIPIARNVIVQPAVWKPPKLIFGYLKQRAKGTDSTNTVLLAAGVFKGHCIPQERTPGFG